MAVDVNGHRAVESLRTPRVGIIGAGMSGIGMAAKLRLAGIESFHIYEKSDDLGGTWHANTYPGLTCDIPSRYYSYTFAPNPNWSSVYSPGKANNSFSSSPSKIKCEMFCMGICTVMTCPSFSA